MEVSTNIEPFINFNTIYQKISAKVIIKVDNQHYLFSIKNDFNNMLKHRKLELLGGNMDIDDDENTHQTLVRELEEEEKTSRLADMAKEQAQKMDSIIIQGKKGLQLYNIYFLNISMKDYINIKNHYLEAESFGFVLMKSEQIEDRRWFGKNCSMFTPKTNILFSAMLISGSKFRLNLD
jgi:hypothetical protein